jgi:Holliday junction resolvase RusA-like endonuclease
MIISLRLTDQIPSGKNCLIVRRDGRRVPRARFRLWRDDAVRELAIQVMRYRQRLPLRVPVHIEAIYAPQDRRRRDLPGMLDAVCHVLERAGIIEDDAQVTSLVWRPAMSSQAVCLRLTIWTEDQSS